MNQQERGKQFGLANACRKKDLKIKELEGYLKIKVEANKVLSQTITSLQDQVKMLKRREEL